MLDNPEVTAKIKRIAAEIFDRNSACKTTAVLCEVLKVVRSPAVYDGQYFTGHPFITMVDFIRFIAVQSNPA